MAHGRGRGQNRRMAQFRVIQSCRRKVNIMKYFGNTPPSKETVLKMANLYHDAWIGRDQSLMWYYLLAWANYKDWVKYEWSAKE